MTLPARLITFFRDPYIPVAVKVWVVAAAAIVVVAGGAWIALWAWVVLR